MHSNKREAAEIYRRLEAAGITYDDAVILRKLSMTLHRWHELECGVEGGGVCRDETTGRPHWYNSYTGRLDPKPMHDREKGARARLASIMARYPDLSAYIQTDPRGAALHILRPGDVPDGERAEAYYTRGIAVW